MAENRQRSDNKTGVTKEGEKPAEQNKPSDRKVEYNKFVLNDVHPDAGAVFAFAVRPLNVVAPSAVVVLDTNVLLVPYTIGPKSFGDIRATYERLKTELRLVIPGQVAREFARLRGRKLSKVFQQLHDRRSKLSREPSGKHPLLESVPEYVEAVAKEEEMLRLGREQSKLLGEVMRHVSSWRWDDPVSQAYQQLFDAAVVVDPKLDQENAEADLRKRTVHSIPPAYKDQSKDDGGIGDLLIWYTILEIGAVRSADVIFVSGEEKADWWHKSAGQPLFPRYELVDEFRRKTQGKSFHLVTLAQLLELYNVETSTVVEVRTSEQVEAAAGNVVGRPSLHPLSAALRKVERDTLALAAQGWSIGRIAERLGISSEDATMRLFDAERTLEQLEAERATTSSTIVFASSERWDITRGCIEFSANVNGYPITCRISEEALEDYFGAAGVPTLVPVFNAFRPAIEAVARRKILHRNLQDGAVSITTDDFSSRSAG